MIPFFVAATLLTLLVIALITRPLRSRAAPVALDPARLNASLLTDEFAALEREHADGAVSGSDYAQAHDDLMRRLLEEAAPYKGARGSASKPLRTFLAIAVLVPMSAGLLYTAIGTPEALDGAQPATVTGARPEVEKMVASLAAKLAAHPDNAAGWAMLGRSYNVLGRYDDAVAAFEKIGPQLDQNPGWLAEFADVLAMKAGGNPVGRPEQVSLQALHLDPDNLLALMVASYGATARADFSTAAPMIEHALQLVRPDSDDQRFLLALREKSLAFGPRNAEKIDHPRLRSVITKGPLKNP